MGPETERSGRKTKFFMEEVSIHSTTQPFNEHLDSTYYVPGSVLDSGCSAVSGQVRPHSQEVPTV